MSFHFQQEPVENMQDILRSAVEIVNDDFDYNKFVQAFSNNDPWLNKTKSIPPMTSQGHPERKVENYYSNDGLRSCPPMRQPVFTFDEGSFFTNKPDLGANEKNKSNPNETTPKRDLITKNGIPIAKPILKVQITGNPGYELDESDILNIFSRFGNVVSIELGKHRTAFIVFDEIPNAAQAQKSLNNQYMRHLDIKLYVSWAPGAEEAFDAPTDELAMISPNSKGIYNNVYPPQNLPGPTSSKSLPNLDSLPSFPYNPAKFTCKYEIQIDNDKDFKIARKIIGPKGCNMKKIIELCQMQIKRRDITQQSDFLKLRLRGRGSGFKEGPEQRESDDPLHLCVSSKYQEVYAIACKYVEDLLGSLYKEYEVFCQKAGKPLSEPVEMKRIEIINGVEKKPEDGARGSQRKSSIEVNMTSNTKSMINLNGESPNNSLTILSDKDSNSPKDPRHMASQTKSP